MSDAKCMLRALSGKSHRVITAYALIGYKDGIEKLVVEAVSTEVVFRELGGNIIQEYVDSKEWEGKAGAYAIQGIAAAFVSAVNGSVTNVIGLPLSHVLCAFEELAGITIPYSKGHAS